MSALAHRRNRTRAGIRPGPEYRQRRSSDRRQEPSGRTEEDESEERMSTADRNLTRLHRDWGLSPSTLAPGCFASVMATGIVSIGAQLKGLPVLSGALFWLAV